MSGQDACSLSRGGEARLAHALISVEHIVVVLKQNTLTGERRRSGGTHAPRIEVFQDGVGVFAKLSRPERIGRNDALSR